MKLYRIADELTMITGVYDEDMTTAHLDRIRDQIADDWFMYRFYRGHSFRFSLDFMALIEKVNTPEILLVRQYQEANA